MAKKGTSSVKMPMTGQHKMSGGYMMDNKTMNKIMGTSTKKKGK